ncbi:glycosyltransferase family 4 protein [Williamsia sp. MIQD14]|uniref:glycosyltransferase family 4 protein n=1 Tax=Williamsia sp. MIQD14 TaxID=3425703 RepID=UPI003D9FC8A4
MASHRTDRGPGEVAARPGRASIAIVGINYDPEVTGIGPYTSGLAEGLSARGFAVSVHTGVPHYPQWRKSVVPPPTAVGGDTPIIRRVNHYVPSIVTAAGRARMEISFATRSIAAGLGRPDAIIVVSPPLLAAAAVSRYARIRHIPVGLIVQDLYSLGAIETGLARGRTSALIARIEAALLRRATAVVVIHDRFAQSIAALGVHPRRVTTIRNWTHVQAGDAVRREATRDRLGWRPGEIVALHTGNMGVKQGLENVIEAAAAASAVGAPVRFVLIGDGNQRRHLQDAARGVGAVEFLDPLPEAEYMSVLGAADVLLVNERRGVADMASPSKLTSYFASGRPVIAAVDPNGVTAEEIARSGAGVTVAPADSAALLDAILGLHPDADRMQTLAENGRRYAAAVLDADAALNLYALWCHELVGAA